MGLTIGDIQMIEKGERKEREKKRFAYQNLFFGHQKKKKDFF